MHALFKHNNFRYPVGYVGNDLLEHTMGKRYQRKRVQHQLKKSRYVMVRGRFYYPSMWESAREDIEQLARLVALEADGDDEQERDLARVRLHALAKELGYLPIRGRTMQ